MPTLIKFLRGFVTVWIWLGTAFIVLCVIGLYYQGGTEKVVEVMNPFNLWNYAVGFVLFLPAFGAHMLADKLSKRTSASAPSTSR